MTGSDCATQPRRETNWKVLAAAAKARHGCGCGERDSSVRMVVSFWRQAVMEAEARESVWRSGVLS